MHKPKYPLSPSKSLTKPTTMAADDAAKAMREMLAESHLIKDTVVSSLGSLDHRLSALHSVLLPTQIKTQDILRANENIDKTLKAAQLILTYFDLSRQAEATILKGPHDDLESYLEAIEQLKEIIRFFSSKKSFKTRDNLVKHSEDLLARAVAKLEEEFKQLLSSYSKPLKPERLFKGLLKAPRPLSEGQDETDVKSCSSHSYSDHHDDNLENAVYTPPDLLPPCILLSLHTLSQQMVLAGKGKQLLKIYRDTRSYVLEETLHNLGVGKLIKEDVQEMLLEGLEAKIAKWVQIMRISIKLLFAGERKICDQMFEGMESLQDQCFAEVTATSVSMLLGFAEAIARIKRSPDKLFVLLDMYDILRELQPEIETLFEGKACTEIRTSTLALTKQLAQIAQDTIGDLEELIEKDFAKADILDGTVHPLTSYVINYVKFLIDYRTTLKELFQEIGNGDGTDFQLVSVTMGSIKALLTNLYEKSKHYRDPALAHLFLMNNVQYVVRSVRRTEAKDLLGDDWVQKHRRIVQQHANQYQRIAWTKTLQSLSVQGMTSSSGSSSSGVSRTRVKDRLKMFNIQFEDLHLRQSQWTIPDTELRESLRLAVAEVLLPAYRSFLKRFGSLVENGKNFQKYIRYTPEELDAMLGDFFESKMW